MLQGLISDIDRFATHDGPGIRTAIFFQGCPLHCAWCHSPETQPAQPVLLYRRTKCIECGKCIAVCPQGAIRRNLTQSLQENPGGIKIDTTSCKTCFTCVDACVSGALARSACRKTCKEITDIIAQDKLFYHYSGGGVTLSGGEVLQQAAFACEILEFCQCNQIHTAIETSGYGTPEQLFAVAKRANLIYYDIKLMNDDQHKHFVGAGNTLILENLKMLSKNRTQVGQIVVRVPCIPAVNDSPAQIEQTAKFVVGLGLPFMELLPYNEAAAAKYAWVSRTYAMPPLHARSKAYYAKLQGVLDQLGLMSYETYCAKESKK